MLSTRIRPAGAALLAALFLSGAGSSAQKEKAPPPKPVADREQTRKELEALLAGRPAVDVVAFVEQLAQEWPARKGGYEVAHQRFTAHVAELGKAQQRLDELKPPPDQSPLVLRPADVDAAIKDAQTRADYTAARAKHTEGLKDALASVVAAGAEFDRAILAADDHLFKMRTAAALATKAGAAKLPDAVATKQLDDAERKLKTLSVEARPPAVQAKAQLLAVEAQLPAAKAAAEEAAAKRDALKSAQADTLAALKFEEQARGVAPAQLADEFTRLRKQLAEKLGAIEGDKKDYAEARAKAEAKAGHGLGDPFGAVPLAPVAASSAPPLDRAARELVAARQYLAARVRALDARAEDALAVVAALDEMEKKAVAYLTTLDDARRMTRELAALAAEIGRRVGSGDLDPAKAPDGVPEAAANDGRAKLDTAATEVRTALEALRRDRDAIRKPDADVENIKPLAGRLLAHVNERIELLAELKRLAADYTTARKDRPDAEQKRLDQKAAERLNKDAAEWDWALAVDRSQPAADAAELLAAYYKELIDYDERADNLKRQKETLDSLLDLTRREADDVAKLRVLLDKRVAGSGGAKAWDGWLAARLAPAGLKVEESAYHEEAARLGAVAGANVRRVEALTGNGPTDPSKTADQTKLAASGGEIGRARGELQAARLRGLRTTGIKIGIILLATLLIPRILLFVLGRAIRGSKGDTGSPSPVLAALRGVLKAGTWIAAIALILSTLGYDVTALVIALAIGTLAIALAARPMIGDVLGSVVIFAERRFKVGDVVRLSGGDPARVVGLTWRSTSLKNTNGLVVSVPNRTVTEATVENLSKGGETYDAIAVTVSTDKDAGKVINVIRGAVAQCKNVSPDNGVTVVRYNQKGAVKVVEYRFWWFLKDYETRNKTRDEVFARIALGLAHEDMTGIEVTLG